MTSLPPLVEPAASLANDEIARYSRHLVLPDVGPDGQRRLKAARVLVIGAGGLGSPVLLYLAAAGVGTIGIVEFDVVEESNLQRQIIHGQSDIGRPKAQSARDAVVETNPFVTVHLHDHALDVDNAVALFGGYDLVVDGTDNFATRYLVNDAAVLAGKPYVWGSIHRFEGQVSVFWDDAPDGRGLNYRDLYPQAPPPGSVPSCAEGGVLGMLCGTVGSVMATEVVKLITGTGDPLLGRVLLYDALRMSFRTVDVRKDPDAAPITALDDYEALCGTAPEASDADATSASDTLSPVALRDRLAAPRPPFLVDVREPVEWDIAHIDGATLIPLRDIESGAALDRVPRDRPSVLYCKTGIRSARALAALRDAGVTDVAHLDGGIAAWTRQVDPSLPAY
ncbi:MAG: adenylyltransferase/sulfurtransferase MoeZ [Gordonia paraffinivorans]